jgi:NAD(P)-dependent dehydrogenase (short-subunit alcohol dehydrogenase family)
MAGVQDRVVVVTGAGGGLGREYALLLAREGAQVVVNDLGGARDGSGSDQSAADKVVGEIVEAGGRAVANHDSVATAEGGAAIVATALESFGRIDGIVANAGILRDRTFVKMTDEDWDAVLQVHLYGAYNVIHSAWPHFREQAHGRIVVATSTTGLYGNFGQANYGAAKLGLVGLINSLSKEGAKYDIKANAVAPVAATRMTADIMPQEVLDKLPPDFVAPLIGYLCGDEVEENGATFVAGFGRYHRVELFHAAGARFEKTPTVAELAAQWSAVVDLSAPAPGMGLDS